MKTKFLIIHAIFFIVYMAAAFPAAAQAVPADNAPAETAQILVPDTNLPAEPEKRGQASDTIAENKPEADAQEPAHSKLISLAQRVGIVLGIIAGQVLLIWLIWLLFGRFSLKAAKTAGSKINPIKIKNITLLTPKQIVRAILVLLKICKYLVTFIQLYLTLPIIFSLFPATEGLAAALFGYILNPLHDGVSAAIEYIPNLITIIIIVIVIRYIIRALKYFTVKIARGKIDLPGFYPDLVEPTFNILRVLLWAFAVALIYPYLPGSHSQVFQGVSVFVGIIFSLGSTSAMGNLVAGLVITYMRSFKIGDRVRIKEVTGFVVEKTLMAVRLRTHKNEYVTFPNVTILSSEIINYNNSSAEDSEGLILNTEITFAYSTPWQTIHAILINAALATDYVEKTPAPFVLQTGMEDFYARYQINCYTKEIDKVPAIYASLYENIQNGFHAAGIDMTCAHFRIVTHTNK
ncbi:MAG: mechanosensitive ion channel family protein [Spirochaetota bacterium]|jgi:small-conductance mechanosensitive channel|nr:mechanosensitive ion channel family protein [Spirochaetota bacterium]